MTSHDVPAAACTCAIHTSAPRSSAKLRSKTQQHWKWRFASQHGKYYRTDQTGGGGGGDGGSRLSNEGSEHQREAVKTSFEEIVCIS